MPHLSPYALRFLFGGLAALLASTALALWLFTRSGAPPAPGEEPPPQPDPPTPDPRLVFDTPFRNVKPDVGYVGDAVCARCHKAITQSYHAHPMGRSAELVSRATPIEKYDPSGHTSFSSGAFDLEVENSPPGVRHRVRLRGSAPAPVAEFVTAADVAIGSGTRGRSYLRVEGDTLWQTPISWFGPEERWDVSPGFRLGTSLRRAIGPACLYCHVDRVEPVPGADNRYREPLFPQQVAIGCERCHGPGALHAAERAVGVLAGMDTSIVNPRHLSHPLQTAICEQCHLQGEARIERRGRTLFEFRPGLPFEQFASVYVRHPETAAANPSVGQFEQMEQSRCFSGSRGTLGCTSCHDPHSVPERAARDAHYRGKCLTCHDSHGCSLPPGERRDKGDGCIACHMPKAASSTIIHASVTNHRIPRTPGTRPAPKGLPFGTPPLLRFRSGPFSPPPEEQDRDLGIALAHVNLPVLAAERLQGSLARWPGDVEAWQALATLRADRGKEAERFRAARNAVALAPQSESALAALAEAAAAAGQFDEADEAAGKRVRLNPRATDPLLSRAVVSLRRGDWERLEADCRAILLRHPLHPQVHLYLAICLHKRGDSAAGLRELETALRLEPDEREQELLKDGYRRAIR